MEQMQTQELISALADGRLQGEAFGRGVELAVSDPVAREAWAAYHLIGDVLRSGELAIASDPSAFMARLNERLRDEQPIGAPASLQREEGAFRAPARDPANDVRWKVLAGFASLAAVGAIAWNLAGPVGVRPPAAELAKAGPGAQATPAGERAVMIRDPQLDELLAAHRQLRGPSALQISAGFVRNATFDAGGR